MFAPATLALFTSASLLLAVAPGPDNIFVLTQSMVRGWRVGLIVTLGLCTGLIVHTAAVALGVAALFQASALAFNLLKFVGAAYLAWLAWGALRAPVGSGGAAAPAAGGTGYSAWRMVGRGVVMNLTNPKVLVFFLAFLPQFADPARGAMGGQLMVLGLVFIVATLLVFGAIACFSGVFGSLLLRSPRAQQWLNRVAGVVFLGLAVRLATSQR